MDNDSPPERFYAGEFRHAIDEKNRITIPSRWRRDKAEEFILLPEATHQFLLVMSPKEFARTSSAEKQTRLFPRVIAGFFCAICIHARSTQAQTGRGGLFCPKSFVG